jgi:hypothetical protein
VTHGADDHLTLLTLIHPIRVISTSAHKDHGLCGSLKGARFPRLAILRWLARKLPAANDSSWPDANLESSFG